MLSRKGGPLVALTNMTSFIQFWDEMMKKIILSTWKKDWSASAYLGTVWAEGCTNSSFCWYYHVKFWNEILTLYRYRIVQHKHFSLPQDILVSHGGRPGARVWFSVDFHMSFEMKIVPNLKLCILKILWSTYVYPGRSSRLMKIHYLQIYNKLLC